MTNPYEWLEDYVNQPLDYKKEFCPLMNMEYEKNCTSKRKKEVLKKLNQYMDIQISSRKVLINKIYNEEEITLLENKGKYLTHIENFLMLFLSKEAMKGENNVILTNRNILEMSSMVNPEYFKGMNSMYKYVDLFNIHVNNLDIPNDEMGYYELEQIYNESHIFFSASYRLFKRLMNDCLTAMEKKSLILKNKTFVCYKTYKIGDCWYSETHICDDAMIQKILTVQYEALKEFNEFLAEKYQDKTHQVKDVDITYFLTFREREELKKIINIKFTEKFKDEGFTGFSKAWELKLANGVCFEKELESRKFDWKRLNNNVMDKLRKSKDLSGILLNNDFINAFIKNSFPLPYREIAKLPKKYKK